MMAYFTFSQEVGTLTIALWVALSAPSGEDVSMGGGVIDRGDMLHT
jgi:hypothetical protein